VNQDQVLKRCVEVSKVGGLRPQHLMNLFLSVNYLTRRNQLLNYSAERGPMGLKIRNWIPGRPAFAE
jgi:hypothetical protein